MSKNNLQDEFLNALRVEKILVSVYLVNGIKLQGRVARFDAFVISLENNIVQLIYKHAISSIVPSRNPSISTPKASS